MRKGLIPLCLFASLILASCATEEVVTDVWESDYSINLNALVASSEEGSTRAGDADVTNPGTEAGETEMNENKLVTLDFFFYQLGADENADALYHLFYKPGVETTWTKNQAVTRETLKMLVGDALAANAQCNVYVVANCYEGTAASPTEKFTGTESRNTLRKTQIVSTFNENVKQDCFVMEGEALASLQQTAGGQYQLTGSISLYRSAAKARLSIMIDPEAKANGVDDANGNKWYPSTEGMKCMLVNGVKQGYVSRELSAGGQNYSFLPQATDYFPLSMTNKLEEMTTYGREMRTEKTDDDGNTWYKHDYPFYSYRTVDWKEQTNREAYMLLMVPWTRTNGSTTVTANTFYQVPMPIKSTEQEYRLKSYRYYRMEVEVGSMGSFSIEDPVLIKNNSYIVVDWGVTGTAFTADLDPVKYLAVYETSIVMDDTDTKEIQFASSDDIQVVNATVTMRQRNLNSTSYLQENWTTFTLTQQTPVTEGDVTTTTWSANNSGNPITIVINNETGVITFTHELKNEIASTGDFTEYEISFTVAHGGTDEIYRETINITQYPMLPVKRELNSNFTNNTWNNSANNNRYGYVYINNAQSSKINWSAVRGLVSENNHNPNRYIISVSALSNGNYLLGDPRTSSIDNNLGLGNNSWSFGPSTTSLATAQAWGSYSTYQSNSYVSYAVYTSLSATYVTRTTTTVNENDGPGRNNWGSYTSEENAYGPDANSYYYWRSVNNNRYTYNRVRYTMSSTVYTRNLTYYHPTENSERTERMLSPEFLVASSYGVCGTAFSLNEARRRCAAYQEDGYPAGRWRVPTYAEVEYIISLSAWGKIPVLFNNSSPYWSAHGLIQNSNGTIASATGTSGFVRCVYDTWYWGEEKVTSAQNTFTWGDTQDAGYWDAQ